MGRLNLATPEDVLAATLNADLRALDPTLIQRLIDRVEAMIDRYGRFDTEKPGYAEDMKTAVILAVERLFYLSDPDFLKNAVQGVVAFKAGSYQQENSRPRGVLGGEVAQILNFYCIERYQPDEVWYKKDENPFTKEE